EYGGDRAPEGGRVVCVRHRLLPGRLLLSRRAPVQIEDRVQVVLVETIDVSGDGVAVVGAAIGRIDAVDVEPAVLIQGNPDAVDVPAGHGTDRVGVAGAVKDAPTLDAGILRSGAVH